MTTHAPDQQGHVHFGRWASFTAHIRALDAIGVAVPGLETQLGFPISVTVLVRPEGALLARVVLPDQHYSFEAILLISDVLQGAVKPYGVELDIVPDSDSTEYE